MQNSNIQIRKLIRNNYSLNENNSVYDLFSGFSYIMWMEVYLNSIFYSGMIISLKERREFRLFLLIDVHRRFFNLEGVAVILRHNNQWRKFNESFAAKVVFKWFVQIEFEVAIIIGWPSNNLWTHIFMISIIAIHFGKIGICNYYTENNIFYLSQLIDNCVPFTFMSTRISSMGELMRAAAFSFSEVASPSSSWMMIVLSIVEEATSSFMTSSSPWGNWNSMVQCNLDRFIEERFCFRRTNACNRKLLLQWFKTSIIKLILIFSSDIQRNRNTERWTDLRQKLYRSAITFPGKFLNVTEIWWKVVPSMSFRILISSDSVHHSSRFFQKSMNMKNETVRELSCRSRNDTG